MSGHYEINRIEIHGQRRAISAQFTRSGIELNHSYPRFARSLP